MKKIQGKIKFVCISIPNNNFTYDIDNSIYTSIYCNELGQSYEVLFNEEINCKIIGKLSEITEEQAAEFVELSGEINPIQAISGSVWNQYDDVEGNLSTAKESLISLLKTNDVWIKEWCNCKDFDKKSEKDKLDTFDQIQFQNDCPDDLLLIKLI